MSAAGGDEPRFRADLEISAPSAGDRPRVVVWDPRGERELFLGTKELAVARLFDGRRTAEEVRGAAAQALGGRLGLEQVLALRQKLIDLGVLEAPGAAPPPSPANPFTGAPQRGAARLLQLRLVTLRGDAWVRRLLARAPWLGRPAALVALGLVTLAGAAALVRSRDLLSGELAALVPLTWATAVWVVASGAAGNALHELGHAVACCAQGVPVRTTGVMLRYFFLSAWVRPAAALAERPRAGRWVAALAGPAVSFAIAGASALAWSVAEAPAARHAWLCAAVSNAFGGGLTLVPFHQGDGYQIVADALGRPGLRDERGFRAGVVVWRAFLWALIGWVLWRTFA
ncbi:MAG TPA: hypothetical protein VMZ28_12415 [Kofleriaceae bacterium]|nr:hypothetical protein [Kofleriaceae bacterium]